MTNTTARKLQGVVELALGDGLAHQFVQGSLGFQERDHDNGRADRERRAQWQARCRRQVAQRERGHRGHLRGDPGAHFHLVVKNRQQQRDGKQRGGRQPGLPQHAAHAAGERHQDEVAHSGLRFVRVRLALRADEQPDKQSFRAAT